jgi:hypothetical protein
VAQSGALLEVADGQLDHGVAAMIGVQLDGGAGPVGTNAWWRQAVWRTVIE